MMPSWWKHANNADENSKPQMTAIQTALPEEQ